MKNAGTIRRLLTAALLLAALYVFALSANAETVASGTCGKEDDGGSLTWTLDDAGTLTVSGAGAMKDSSHYNDKNNAPWGRSAAADAQSADMAHKMKTNAHTAAIYGNAGV